MSKFRALVENILITQASLLIESEQKVKWLLSQPKIVQQLTDRLKTDEEAPKDITPEELLKTFDSTSKVTSKFLSWITKLYANNGFKYTDISLIDTYLTDFAKNSNKLEKKDINAYKSLTELQTALNSIKNIKGSNEQKRNTKAEAEKVFENDKWLILIPHSEAAAIRYGKGTSWCTSSTQTNNMFDKYTEYGPLYIIINKHDPAEKYQFHFETNEFMDSSNKKINLRKFIKENPQLKNFFESIRTFDKSDFRDWVWFDNLDYDTCLNAVKHDLRALHFVPEKFKDYNMCYTAVKSNHFQLGFPPEKLNDYNTCLEAIKKEGFVIDLVPTEIIDYNMCLEAVKTGAEVIFFIPEKYKDYNLYMEMLKNDWSAIEYIPKEFKDYNMCLEAVKKSDLALDYVPEKFKDYRMYLAAVKTNGKALSDVPEKFRDYNMCLTALQNVNSIYYYEDDYYYEGNIFDYIPKEFLNYDFYLKALKGNIKILPGIPDKFLDKEMQSIATKDPSAIEYIPDHLLNYDLCLAAVKKDGFNIQYVPHEFKDKRMYLTAVENNGLALEYIPDKFKDYDICLAATKENPEAIDFVPDEYAIAIQHEKF